jgi:hypothetical protein
MTGTGHGQLVVKPFWFSKLPKFTRTFVCPKAAWCGRPLRFLGGAMSC